MLSIAWFRQASLVPSACMLSPVGGAAGARRIMASWVTAPTARSRPPTPTSAWRWRACTCTRSVLVGVVPLSLPAPGCFCHRPCTANANHRPLVQVALGIGHGLFLADPEHATVKAAEIFTPAILKEEVSAAPEPAPGKGKTHGCSLLLCFLTCLSKALAGKGRLVAG